MKIISNSSNTNHWERFKTLCKKADELVMASPFCHRDFELFADTIQSIGGIKKIVFITTLKGEETADKIDHLLSFANEMNRIGVDWRLSIDNRLHGKVYIFKDGGTPYGGIITSANLTRNGMVANHEWGCELNNPNELAFLEKQLFKDIEYSLVEGQLEGIKKRAVEICPSGQKKVEPISIDYTDIISPKGTRIFIKPIGHSEEPVTNGDFSEKTKIHFSRRRPISVRKNDILITYAVGKSQVIGAYRVESDIENTNIENDRWPWYVNTKALTPTLANEKWVAAKLIITNIANDYAKERNKPVTNAGGKNLKALNYGCDKIRLADDFGHHLLSLVTKKENELR